MNNDNQYHTGSWFKVIDGITQAYSNGYVGTWDIMRHKLIGVYLQSIYVDKKKHVLGCYPPGSYMTLEFPFECTEVIPNSHALPHGWIPSEVIPNFSGKYYHVVVGVTYDNRMQLVTYTKHDGWLLYMKGLHNQSASIKAWSYISDWVNIVDKPLLTGTPE